MADSFIKQEIKQDPDGLGASPAGFDDEDIYEDTGDLEFNLDPAYQDAYLARVPKYVWEAWSKLDDDAEIRIGTIRQMRTPMPNGKSKESLHMLLASNIAQHQTVPKEYELEVTNENLGNTFVFTEKDLPGFKSRSQKKFDIASANMPSRLSRKPPAERKPYDPNQRFVPYFKKAVPKHTKLTARIRREVNAIAVDNDETERLLAQRTLEAMAPKRGTTYLGKNTDVSDLGDGFLQPGMIQAKNSWNTFIVRSGAPEEGKKKKEVLKAARMPQNELMDKIFECFQEFNYWSMKAFKQRLLQPETYLRETLDNVAILHKSGSFAAQWSLKDEYKEANYDYALTGAAAPVEEMDEDSGDEDGDVKFEDVP